MSLILRNFHWKWAKFNSFFMRNRKIEYIFRNWWNFRLLKNWFALLGLRWGCYLKYAEKFAGLPKAQKMTSWLCPCTSGQKRNAFVSPLLALSADRPLVNFCLFGCILPRSFLQIRAALLTWGPRTSSNQINSCVFCQIYKYGVNISRIKWNMRLTNKMQIS